MSIASNLNDELREMGLGPQQFLPLSTNTPKRLLTASPDIKNSFPWCLFMIDSWKMTSLWEQTNNSVGYKLVDEFFTRWAETQSYSTPLHACSGHWQVCFSGNALQSRPICWLEAFLRTLKIPEAKSFKMRIARLSRTACKFELLQTFLSFFFYSWGKDKKKKKNWRFICRSSVGYFKRPSWSWLGMRNSWALKEAHLSIPNKQRAIVTKTEPVG